MKIMISKNKDGNGYYTKIQNDYNGKHTEKYLTLQLPRDTDLEYGLYDVDGFLSTYEKRDGTVEFKLVITDVQLLRDFSKAESNNETKKENILNTKTESDWGKQLEITESDLPF